MTVSVVLGDGQLATQDMTAAFANYYVASSSSPHYLTETYLIGSMKVLMGLHRKFQKTILSMKKFSVSVVREKIGFKHVVFFLPFFLPCSFPLALPLHLLQLALSFTLKYAKYVESYNADVVRHIYKKACSTHLPRKPAIHLLWAAFEEQQGG